MFVEVKVSVPGDRVGDLQVAFGGFVSTGKLAAPPAGSSKTEWREVSLAVSDDKVQSFQEAFGSWLTQALAPAVTTPLEKLRVSEFNEVWRDLNEREREALRLMADDSGRAVGWPELKEKLGLAGEADVAAMLPQLSAFCEAKKREMPVRYRGKGDEQVFFLPAEVIDVVNDAD
jgi:hypothetical protein